MKTKSGSIWTSKCDAFDWLKKIRDSTVDLVITDFPYESLEKYRAMGTTTRLSKSKASSNEWFGVIPNSRLLELCSELYRVLKPKTHCYLFCDDETSDFLKVAAQQAGFHVWKRIVWNKMVRGMGYHYANSYEFILFLEKGKSPAKTGKIFNGTRQLNTLSCPDILDFKRIKGSSAYPAEKPLELMELLVTNSSIEGELVIDPFQGSGVVGLASLKNGRYFWGCDIAPESLRRTDLLLNPYEDQETLISTEEQLE